MKSEQVINFSGKVQVTFGGMLTVDFQMSVGLRVCAANKSVCGEN